jgi:hypothetical protein
MKRAREELRPRASEASGNVAVGNAGPEGKR